MTKAKAFLLILTVLYKYIIHIVSSLVKRASHYCTPHVATRNRQGQYIHQQKISDYQYFCKHCEHLHL